MLRVFLVIDDYNELIYLQTLLKKLGFDVEGLQNQKKYHDLSLGFNPHILITSAKGRKVDGIALAKSISKKRGLPKIIALKSAGPNMKEQELVEAGIDMQIDTPVMPKALIGALSLQGGVDEAALLEKYAKIKGTLETDGESHIIESLDETGQTIQNTSSKRSEIEELAGLTNKKDKSLHKMAEVLTVSSQATEEETFSVASVRDPQRQARFAKAEKELGPIDKKNFNREKIKEFNKIIRSWPQPDDIEEIENERKKFVEALFKKK